MHVMSGQYQLTFSFCSKHMSSTMIVRRTRQLVLWAIAVIWELVLWASEVDQNQTVIGFELNVMK